MRIAKDIAARRERFAPVALGADVSVLPPGEREALPHLAKAARAVDEIFWRQAWEGNAGLAERVAELDEPAARDYYRIMRGPWDRLEAFEPFLGDARRPQGAGFYPDDLGTDELEGWLKNHPDDRDAFVSPYTVLRRDAGGLVAVPYSRVYARELAEAASHLRAAAGLVENGSLKSYLALRAEAFSTDDYFASDVAWMELDSPLELVIGPYETYEDGLFGYKAAFEAFLYVAQPTDAARLESYKAELPFLEANLPIPDEHKNFRRALSPPIRVVDELLAAGEAGAGVQTAAFNLPNDERVREAKGCKNVLLKNVMRAKFEAILTPIASRVLPRAESGRLAFDAYFHFILFHELAHGLGPGRIRTGGRESEVRLELRELYSPIEEAKADTLSVFNLLALSRKGLLPEGTAEALPWAYAAGLFRTARFGTTEAHGLGVALQASALLEKGALVADGDGRFAPVPERFPRAFEEIAHELLTVQAHGDYAGAKALLARWGKVPQAMERLLGTLGDVPVDVDPTFTLEKAGGA